MCETSKKIIISLKNSADSGTKRLNVNGTSGANYRPFK